MNAVSWFAIGGAYGQSAYYRGLDLRVRFREVERGQWKMEFKREAGAPWESHRIFDAETIHEARRFAEAQVSGHFCGAHLWDRFPLSGVIMLCAYTGLEHFGEAVWVCRRCQVKVCPICHRDMGGETAVAPKDEGEVGDGE